jgi:prepilin-type processing-associated H-X9-DG protein
MKSIVPNLIVAVLVSSAGLLRAQPLSDRVPAEAIVYVGWAGTDAMPPAYADSHLKAVLDNSRIPALFSEFLPQWSQRVAVQTRGQSNPLQLMQVIFNRMLKHPTALYFAGIDMTNPRDPSPRFGLICLAGADAINIQQQLGQFVPQAPPSAMLRSSVVQDDTVLLTIGRIDPAQAITAVHSPQSLEQSPAFSSALKQVQRDAVMAVYVDGEKLMAMVDGLIQANTRPPERTKVTAAIDALGLRGLKQFMCTSGFDGKDWMSQSFTGAPSPRTGLLEAMDAKPVSADLLKAIPADATFAAAGKFDPARLITRIREGAGKVDPQAQTVIDRVLSGANAMMGRNVMTDLLEPLGEDWAAYCAPSVSGNGILGTVIVNRLDDPAKAGSSFPIAWVNLSNWTNTALRQARADVQVSGQTVKIDGMNVNYIGAPLVAPAWTIRDGNFYLGLYPQSVAAAARWTHNSTGKSLAENEKFIALQKRLGVSNPTGFSYFDLPTSGTQGSSYQQLLALTRYGGISDLFGVPLPEPLLPPLDVLQQHLAVAGSVAWTDDAGYHEKSVSPFPGSKLLSEPGLVAGYAPATSGLMASILLPSLSRARETANRVKCAANLRTMGQGLLLYANDHKGKYPLSIGELLTLQLPLEIFVCPSSGKSVPANIVNADLQTQMTWVNDNGDYVYMGANKTSSARASEIIVYERADDHGQQGINILYGDGHVDWIIMARANQMIQQQMQRGAR